MLCEVGSRILGLICLVNHLFCICLMWKSLKMTWRRAERFGVLVDYMCKRTF